MRMDSIGEVEVFGTKEHGPAGSVFYHVEVTHLATGFKRRYHAPVAWGMTDSPEFITDLRARVLKQFEADFVESNRCFSPV